MDKNASSSLKPYEIQVLRPVLLSGPVLKFIPALSCCLGSDLHAIVFHQLSYTSREMGINDEWIKAKRISLTRLQRQLPFVSRRWLIKILNDLESEEFIRVERTKRVNVYIPEFGLGDILDQATPNVPPEYLTNFTVIPKLAKDIGLKNSIVLQQIHIRCHQKCGDNFIIRSLEQWHSEVFPFWGIATIKRVFRKLQELNLTIIKPYRRKDDGFVNSYRVNYIALAELLNLPVPHVENPFSPIKKDSWDNDWKNWTNPVTLKVQSEVQ